MPTPEDCVGEVQAAGGENMSRAEARAVMQHIMDAADRQGIDPVVAAKNFGASVEAAKIVEQRNHLANLRKRIEMVGNVDSRYAQWRQKYGDQALEMAVRAEVRSFNTTAQRSRFSAEATARALGIMYQGGAMRDIENAGLMGAMRSRPFVRDVGKEIYELSMKGAGENGNPGVTNNAQALKAAQIIYGYQSLAKQNLNAAGAWIGDYAGYITKTQHDPLTMYKAGFEGWRDFILTKLDPKTFDGIDDQNKYLRNVYDALVTGIHRSEEGKIGLKEPAFTGASNLAKKLSQSRELHFKDADSWMDYQEQFGNGPFHEQIFNSFARAGKDEALMRRFGTNPRAEYEGLIDRIADKYRDTDQGAVMRLNNRKSILMNEFSNLDGTNAAPQNAQWASFAQGMRNVMSMAHLGNVAWTHLFSMATKISTLRSEGVNFLEATGGVLESLIKGARGGAHDEQEIRDLLLAGFDGQHAAHFSRFTLDDGVPGAMSTATSNFMKYTGLNYVLNAQKAGSKMVMARFLGRQIDKSFDDLHPTTQASLTEYGITPQDWENLRNAADHNQLNGRVYLTPDAADRAGLNPKEASDLALKLATYYDDVANRSVVVPGVAEKAFLNAGVMPGTAVGEALRMAMQFKTWPVAATRQLIGTELRGKGTKAWTSRAASIASLAAAATTLGYLRMTLSDALKGLNPKNPANPMTIAASLAQGGGLGILGDVLFSQGMPDQSAFASMIMGPTFGTIGQVYFAWQRVLQAANTDSEVNHHVMRDLSAQLVKTAMNNTPFVNLWYTRTLLDYLLIWNIQESLNPGYQRRYEQRMKKQGQTFWLSPAKTVAGQNPLQ